MVFVWSLLKCSDAQVLIIVQISLLSYLQVFAQMADQTPQEMEDDGSTMADQQQTAT